MNVPVLVPDSTVVELGTVTPVVVDDRLTMVPAAGAGPLSVTVPVEVSPPVTEDGEKLRLVGTGELIVRVAVSELAA